MFGKNSSYNKAAVALVAALLAVFASSMFVQAVTLVPPVIPDGSIWEPSGNPYIIGAFSELGSGKTLTIEPGVEVVIGPDVTFSINGGIVSAVGTWEDPIIFRGTSESNFWERIMVYYRGGDQSTFEYCTFSDAKTALYLQVYGNNHLMDTDVNNCIFTNCSNFGVYCYAGTEIYAGHSYQNSRIKNCMFFGAGCELLTSGGGGGYRGYPSPEIIGNTFYNVSGFAINMSNGSIYGSGSPVIINNVFDTCDGGVFSLNNYDADIINNIFANCSTAVSRSGSSSLDVHYNCLYNNLIDFDGYPSTYGQVIWSNANGDPSDLFYNIFMDPQFEAGSFELSSSSPCIDAGDPSIVDYYDPILGSTASDMGAYGGEEPGAGVPPSPPVIVSEPQNQTVFLGQDVTFEVEAVGYDLYYQWYFGSTELTGETTDTLTLTNVDFADAGNYYCAVSNVYDVVNSSLANLRVTEIGLDIAMHAGLHMTNLVVGTNYSIQAVYSLSDTNWLEIDSFEAMDDNDVWYDPEPASMNSKFYQVKSQP